MPVFNTGGQLEKLEAITEWQLTKPTTDLEWAEDVKKESLDVKYNYQLAEMKKSHEEKLPKVEKDLDVFNNWPDVPRYQLNESFKKTFQDAGIKIDERFEGKTLQEWIDEEFESQHLFYTYKVAKLQQSIERINKEIELREKGVAVPDKLDDKSENKDIPKDAIIRNIHGTVYYVDPVNGLAANTGLKLTGTVDSTADTSHAVDADLTGADDYINGGYFYNETRGIGAYISDFTTIDDQVHLASAIAGMAAGDTYYILCSWLDLDTFTENARAAGDRCVVRRTAAANCDNASDLDFTSDGTIVAPIVIESDYDNEYHDRTTYSGTITATFGSKTLTGTANVTGEIGVGDWIYLDGDDPREFAYEVSAREDAGDTITLFLPYLGGQAGAGRTLYNIQDNPIWNTAAGNYQWNFDTDSWWKIQGLHIRGSDSTNSQVEIDSSLGHSFIDCIFQGNNVSEKGIKFTDDFFSVTVYKSRFLNDDTGAFGNNNLGDVYGNFLIKNIYISGCDNALNFNGLNNFDQYIVGRMENVEVSGATLGLQLPNSPNIFGRNISLSGTTAKVQSDVPISNRGSLGYKFQCEDYDNTVNKSIGFSQHITSTDDQNQIASETGTVRAGGATISMKVTPTTNLTNVSGWDFSKLLLFELPIYATTDSKTYTVYFNLPDANFTVDPTAAELWIEIEAWGHAANNYRQITKSTGTVAGDGNWNALTVTYAPAQAGIAYLRCYYCKTKEAASNIFYCDPIPTVA